MRSPAAPILILVLSQWAGLAQIQTPSVVIRGILLGPTDKPVRSPLRLTADSNARTLVIVNPVADGSFATPPIPITGREFELHAKGFRSRTVSLSSGRTPATIDLGTVRLEREDLTATVKAPNRQEQPPLLSLCEIAKDPHRFSGQRIRVRGRVRLAFEEFQFAVSECAHGKPAPVWLTYGQGARAQPTTWCCGDLTPNDGPRLEQNEAFERFHYLLTALQPSTHCLGPGCYRYEVTATLTGRLDAVPATPCPAGKGTCCRDGGYGHFGFTCNRLVIQSVQDVSAQERIVVKSDSR